MEVLDYNDYYFRRGKLRKKTGFLGWYYGLLNSKFARRFARRTEKAIIYTFKALGQEARETKAMAKLFFRMLETKLDLEKRNTPPTTEEVKEAVEQLKDIARISVFASISLLPGGGFSLVGLELLARKFGIKEFTFVPSAFRTKSPEVRKNQSEKENTLRIPGE